MVEAVTKPTPVVHADEILTAEFNYIEKTVFQANEDRARVSSYFLSTAGSLIVVILGFQLQQTGQIESAVLIGFSLVFLMLGITGWLTMLQLVRLRMAWYDSVQAMLQIKQYYLTHFADSALQDAFRWKTTTLPHLFKIYSISFLQAIQVAMMSGLMFGAAYFCFMTSRQCRDWITSLIIGSAMLVTMMVVYWGLLKRKK